MNLYLDEMLAGMQEILDLHKQGNNIFEMKGGNMFPNIDRQQMWQFAKGPKHLHFTDGTRTYSFSGDLAEEDTELEKIPDVPLPDMFANAVTKGKAQVHRADPGSIYFTLQEGTKNPTYTFRHTGDSKWKAIPKKKKVKQQLQQPAYIPNVNVEQVKTGMLKELERIVKEGAAQGGALDFFNHAAGTAVTGPLKATLNVAMAPGRIGGAPGTSSTLGNAGKAALLGGGLGLAYHGFKRHFVNTPEENEQETNMDALRRIALPAVGFGAANFALRDLFPNYYAGAARGETPDPFRP